MAFRKTRIVCISDTHNQTPKLPPGDVLIHAGDLTNQGSYSELKKTVEWIEKADFEAKIVIAGNHDTTLDEPFFFSSENKWKWPRPQDPTECRRLLVESSSITYLENETATICLTDPKGPRTRFRVFGSPYSPGRRGWGFQYWEDEAAKKIWEVVEDDVDIVVTHTPPYGHCDKVKGGQAGCKFLLQRLAQTRPMLHVCGHIHNRRGVSKIQWSNSRNEQDASTNLIPEISSESSLQWEDPGAGNKKLSLLNLTSKSEHRLHNVGRLQQSDQFNSLTCTCLNIATSRIIMDFKDKLSCEAADTGWKKKDGGALEHRCKCDTKLREIIQGVDNLAQEDSAADRHMETVVVNAALLASKMSGKGITLNKPIVIDIELPVWGDFES